MPMKRYTPDELAEVLRLHQLWLNDEEGGERANLGGAYLVRANLRGAYLDGANLDGAYLERAYLGGANLILSLEVFSSLYRYTCWAFVTTEGVPWVRMGCLWKSVEEWDSVGIRNSNPKEFPNDGSQASDRRARAFEFTKAVALDLAKDARRNPVQIEPEPPAPFSKGDRTQLTKDARKEWPWAPQCEGEVLSCVAGRSTKQKAQREP